MVRFKLAHARDMELTTGARCQIARAAFESSMRKNLDLLDQLQYAEDQIERAQRATVGDSVDASHTQKLEEQLRDLDALHNRTLQCFAAVLDSLTSACAVAQAEVTLWEHRSPDESVHEDLSGLTETITKSAQRSTDQTRAKLAQQGIHLPSAT